MKNFFIKSLFFTVIFCGGLIGTYFIIRARNGTTATAGDKLTAAKWNELSAKVDAINSIPAGSVVAFNSSTCPTGRTDYTPAYGRFIRGVDKSGTSIDIDGQRTLGNLQTDLFKSHTHPIADANNGISLKVGNGGSDGASFSFNDSLNDGTSPYLFYATSTGGGETRPKNVALLYCVKN